MSFYKFLLPVLAAGVLVAPANSATTYETLHQFRGTADGLNAEGGFAADPAAVLYGLTSNGGNFDNVHCGDGCGTIYSIDPRTGKFATLHKFTESEGITLNGPLAAGGGKIFYGSAGFGGPGVTGGGGTIFKFDGTSKTVTVLYTLKGDNGALTAPVTGVALANGGLYGAAFLGGPGNFGGIYRFDLNTKALKLVYAFNGSTGPKNVGYYMNSNMVAAGNGMIYGATSGGGPKNSIGALFRIDSKTQKVTALHGVDDGNGGVISGPLTVGPDGTLYGTTAQGSTAKNNCGGTGCGSVFKYNPATSKFTVLYSFTGKADGGFPEGNTVINSNATTLYGVTGFGGSRKHGTLYKIDLANNKLTVMYAFGTTGGSMAMYSAPALRIAGGRFYGTASAGGIPKGCDNQGCGTVYKLTP